MIHETEAKRFAEVVDLSINTLSASYQGAATSQLVNDLKTLKIRLDEQSQYSHVVGWHIDDIEDAAQLHGITDLTDAEKYKILEKCNWLGDCTSMVDELENQIEGLVEEVRK